MDKTHVSPLMFNTIKPMYVLDNDEVEVVGEELTVEEVVTKLLSMGAYLGGSRQKLQDFDYSSPRDWDFNIQHFVPENLFDNYPEVNDYVFENFQYIHNSDYDDTNKMDDIKDTQFIEYYKHRLFPHITVVVRKNLALYKKVFDAIPFKYWKAFMWKSEPGLGKLSEEARTDYKIFIRAQFDMLFAVAEQLKPLTKEDCM